VAKKTVCDISQRNNIVSADSATAYTTAKIFTVHLPEGAKKRYLQRFLFCDANVQCFAESGGEIEHCIGEDLCFA
jgi:hypothetical protein